jgi:putative ABC transport system permease protein
MSWMKEGWRRMCSFARRDTMERGLDEEIRFHIDQQTEKNLRAGMTPDVARRQAFVKFGGMERVKESARDEFRPALLEDSVRDLRYGVRALRRAPGFTAVSSLTIALGIGAATAIFSVVNGVLIKPLPYPHSENLVSLSHMAPGVNVNLPGGLPMSATQLFTYRDENRSFEEIGVWSSGTATVTEVAEPEKVQSLQVTAGTLQALGVRPAAGRWFSPTDDSPASPETVMLTFGYWHRRYGGDMSVVGRSMTVDSRPRKVIGVMPEGFHFLDTDADIILPYRFDRNRLLLGQFNYQGLARLKPGVTLMQANADVARMIPTWLKAWPSPPGIDPKMFENARIAPALRSLKEDVVGDIGNVLWVLMGTIGIVLLIACANVANLLLVRAEGRQHELAIRAALGAGWGRIARELLLESLVLGFVGGALGLGLTFGALRLLVAAGPASLPRLSEITVDPAVLSFALIISLLSGLLFGSIPVVKHAGPHIAEALRGSGRTSSDNKERHRARNTLVVVQVALALVLLVGSGLMIRTFHALRAVQPGFTMPDQIQLVRLDIPGAQVGDPERVFRMQIDIRDRIAAIPGVASASFTSSAPMEPFNDNDALLAEDHSSAKAQIPPIRRFKFVSPGFFQTVGTPLVAGRDLTWTEVNHHRPVAVISENLARELWGEPAAGLGKRIRENPTNPWREVVGVVADVYDNGVHEQAPTIVYWPVLIENFWRDRIRVPRSVTFVIRSSRTGSDSFLNEVREAVWAVNANVPLAQVRTLGDVYQRSLARTSFTLVMLAIASLMALVLGLVGIYGVISYAVTQRTREIGIRVALGAQHSELKRMFVRDGLMLAGVGVACGLAAAFPLTRLMTSLLFGISPLDPATYVAVSVVLVGAAALASYVPAHRATAVDPVEALRVE